MEQDQQTQYYENSPAIPYGYQQQTKADLLDKIRPDEVVELARNKLMGKELNLKGEWVTNEALANNAISELGAWDLSNLILSVVNSNTSISKLTDPEIRRRAYSIMETAIRMMIANWKQYEITNSAQIRFIGDIVYSLAFITMKQADAEGIRKMIIGTRTEQHKIAEFSQENRRRSLLNRRDR